MVNRLRRLVLFWVLIILFETRFCAQLLLSHVFGLSPCSSDDTYSSSRYCTIDREDAAFDDARSGGFGGTRQAKQLVIFPPSTYHPPRIFCPPPTRNEIGVLCMYYTILHIDTTTTLCPH